MSAKQDKSQKIAFVYSNLYEIYRKGKRAAELSPSAQAGEAPLAGEYAQDALTKPLAVSGRVLKARDLSEAAHAPTSAEIRAFAPAELLGKRMPKPEVIKALAAPGNPAIVQLKDNLKTLTDLHSRLKFLLQEIEELVK